MDCSPPGSSVHGILQVRILEWVAISSPGDLPTPETEPDWVPSLLCLLHWQVDSLPLLHLRSPNVQASDAKDSSKIKVWVGTVMKRKSFLLLNFKVKDIILELLSTLLRKEPIRK